MTAGQLVSLILAILGCVLIAVAMLVTTADARLGWIGSLLIGIGVVFLTLDASGELS